MRSALLLEAENTDKTAHLKFAFQQTFLVMQLLTLRIPASLATSHPVPAILKTHRVDAFDRDNQLYRQRFEAALHAKATTVEPCIR